jgi:hypothetical protein
VVTGQDVWMTVGSLVLLAFVLWLDLHISKRGDRE